MNIIKKTAGYLVLFGIDFPKMVRSFKGLPYFSNTYRALKNQKGNNSDFKLGKIRPFFDEYSVDSGVASGHYFFQDLLIARKIYENKPIKHIDIGSRTDGFVAHVAVFREIEVFDIRKQQNIVTNIKFKTADLMKLPENMHNYCDSISALHSIEHFGLGRYGDPIDYNGHLKAIKNITRILKTNGKFYFSVPIGTQRINFNAHRVFSIDYLLHILKDDYNLCTFSYVDDKGHLFENVILNDENIKSNCGCNYGCGIFELEKK